MPGPIHEAIVALLHVYPDMAFELAERCGARVHGGHHELEAAPTVFQDPGMASKQFMADWVVVGWAPSSARHSEDELVAVDGVAIEVQLDHDPSKWLTWLIYRIGVRSRHMCRAWTLVISPDPTVRRRARELFEHEPELCPLILEPEMIPVIDEIPAALGHPGMTILSAVMHAFTPLALAAARMAMAALSEVPAEHRRCFRDLVCNSLSEEQMSQLEATNPFTKTYDDYELSAFEKRGWQYTRGVREGREEGRQQVCGTLAETLLAQLQGRGFTLEPSDRSRILACTDPAVLSRWLLRANVVASVSELLSG